MHLVAHHHEVVALGDVGDLAQLGGGEDVPGRVVRVAEQQRLRPAAPGARRGAAGQLAVELVVVEPPSRRSAVAVRTAGTAIRSRPIAFNVSMNGG